MTKPRPSSLTPDTKLKDVLDHFPELEPVLMELSPSFRKLQNPILRRTVARIATLRQVATVGKVDLGTLMRTLQRASGLQIEDYADDDVAPGERPAWADSEQVAKRFDAREMLDSGGNPLQQVTRDLQELSQGEIYELVTSFIPAPLIELARQRGFRAWSSEDEDSIVRTYITHKQDTERKVS